nr:glutathione S-transferase family protein [Halomonas lutea]
MLMFMVEKEIDWVEQIPVDLTNNEHKSDAFRAISPMARAPALELEGGRVLTETRAIWTYLEGLEPEPNLMGVTSEERAFIEMADRRIEWYLYQTIANCVRHAHPGLAALEQPQFPEFGQSQGQKMREVARWLDQELGKQPFISGERSPLQILRLSVPWNLREGS